MSVNDEVASITKWIDKFREEFLCFYKELGTEIKNYQAKINPLTDIAHRRSEIELKTTNLNEAFKSLNKAYEDLSSDLTKLSKGQIEQKDLDTIEGNIRRFEYELKSISDTINNNLFKTKSEKFWLNVKSFLFRIINFICRKGWNRHLVTENNVILLDGPDSYSVPIRTLPERSKNSLFFIDQIKDQIKQGTCRVERTAQLSSR